MDRNVRTGSMPVSGTKVEIFVFIVAAGVAQLVERNLAKVEVASSSLVSRSNIKRKLLKKVSVFFMSFFTKISKNV